MIDYENEKTKLAHRLIQLINLTTLMINDKNVSIAIGIVVILL